MRRSSIKGAWKPGYLAVVRNGTGAKLTEESTYAGL